MSARSKPTLSRFAFHKCHKLISIKVAETLIPTFNLISTACFQISLTKKINKLQYNFNRTIHLLNKRQPAKPQTLKCGPHEVLGRFPASVESSSNPSLSTRGGDINPGIATLQ